MGKPAPLYPRIIALAPDKSHDGPAKWYELLITGTDEVGVLSKVSRVLADHGVNLNPSGGYYSDRPGFFVWTTFADFSGTRSPLESVVRDIKRLEFVDTVNAFEMGDEVFDRFLFPVMVTKGFRGLLFNVEPLLRLEQRFIERFGSPGSAIMFEEGRQYSLELLRQYESILSRDGQRRLLENMVAYLRAAGWGLFEFDFSKIDKTGEIYVQVVDPPSAGMPEMGSSYFTNGLVAGVIEGICKRAVSVKSASYEAPKRTLKLRLKAEDREKT